MPEVPLGTVTFIDIAPLADTPHFTAITPYGVGAFGFVKPSALYQMHRNAAGLTTSISSTCASPDHDFYEVNALFQNVFGSFGSVLVSFGRYFLKSNGDGDSTSYAIRYDYHLSKRTGVYAGVAGVRNHSKASFTANNAGGPGIAVAAGKNITSGIVGIVHMF